MSLDKTAQFISTIELEDEPIEIEVPEEEQSIIIYDEKPSEDVVLELYDPDSDYIQDKEEEDVVYEDVMNDFQLPELPGVENDEFIEVKEEVLELNDSSEEDDKKKPKGPWDWKTGGLENFLSWLKIKFENIPKHNGKSTAGVERAMNYLEELDKHISDAMRIDLDGILDAEKIEDIRSQIDDGISRLQERLSKLEDNYKSKKKKKSAYTQNGLVKEAGTPHVNGMIVSVPLLISRVARTCINGSVSAGHDIEELFKKQVEEFDLTKREQAEVIQLLDDMGYPVRRDRLHMLDEDFDKTSSDNGDYAANYPA